MVFTPLTAYVLYVACAPGGVGARSFYHVGEPILIDEDQPHLWTSPSLEAKLLERVETVPHVVTAVVRWQRRMHVCALTQRCAPRTV